MLPLILGIGGGALGLISSAISIGDNNRKLSKRIKQTEDEKEDALNLLDLKFDIAKEEAGKNADNSDKEVDLQELSTSADFNNQIDAIQLAQEEALNQFNTSAIQSDMQEGNELSSMAASGVRAGTSSMADAIDFERELAEAQLQLQEDKTRNTVEYNLQNLFSGLENNIFKMQMQRDTADDLRKSYDEGGNNYKLYQANRNMTEKSYNNQIKNLENQKSKGFENFIGLLTGGLTGANTGYSMGTNIGKVIENGSYNTGTGLKLSFDNLGSSSVYGNFENFYSNPINSSNLYSSISAMKF